MSAHDGSSTAGATDHTLAAGPAPVLDLYRDTLQSLFQWATLRELHGIRSVCRSWLAAVESLPAVGVDACVPPSLMLTALASTLSNHIGRFSTLPPKPIGWHKHANQLRAPVQITDMAVLSSPLLRASHMHSLRAKLPVIVGPGVAFPSKLTDLDLDTTDCFTRLPQFTAVLSGLGALTSLERLSLQLRQFPHTDFLAPIVVAPRLTHLCVNQQWVGEIKAEQLASVRCCRSLVSLHLPQANSIVLLELLSSNLPTDPVLPLLRSLRMSVLYDDEAAAALMLRVPHLTDLECGFRGSSLSFLSGLTELQSLDIALALSRLDSEQTVAGLIQCPALTSLTLRGSVLHPADLRSVLQRCDRICSLSLYRCDTIVSLEFLSLPRLARDLIDLDLQHCPASQEAALVHLEPLRSLRRLKLVPEERHSVFGFSADGRPSDPGFSPARLRALQRSLPLLESFEFKAHNRIEQAEVDAALAEE